MTKRDMTSIEVLARAVQYLDEIEVVTAFEFSKYEDTESPNFKYEIVIRGTRPRELK